MAAGLVSLVFSLLLVAIVTEARPRLAASNSRVVASGAALVVAPGQQHCEAGQFVPEDAATLRVFPGSESQRTGEPLRLSVTDSDSGQVVDRWELDGGYELGAVDVPLDPPGRDLTDGEVCIENLGDTPMAFAGNRTRLGADIRPHADRGEEDVRIDLLRAGEESLWGMAPEVAHRFALFKPAFAGPWLMWVVLASGLGLVTAAALLAARTPPPVTEQEQEAL